MSGQPPQVVIDPQLRDMPEFRLPPALIESLKIGISLLKIEITSEGIRSGLFASDGSGYEKDVDPVGENFKISSRFFDTDRRLTLTHTQVVKKECYPNTRTLQCIIASLREDIEVDHMVYNAVYTPSIRYTVLNMEIFNQLRMQYCCGMFKSFEEKEAKGWAPLKVKKFSVEFDGTKRCEDEVKTIMQHIQLIGPKEIVFNSPRDRPEPFKMGIQDIYEEPTWKSARKFTMGEGFYVELSYMPVQFLHFVQCSISIHHLPIEILRKMLMNYKDKNTLEFESMKMKIVMEEGWDNVKRVMYVPTEKPYERVSKTCVKYEGRLLCDVADNTLTITQADSLV